MPQYLGLVCIDWHVAETLAELTPVLVEVNARLDSTDHTYQTFNEQLAAIAREQPRLVADMLIDDGWRHYILYRLANGTVTELDPEERPEDAPHVAIELPYDDVVGDLELVYDTEADLREAIRHVDDEGSFVAEAGDQRFLVEIESGSARVRKLVFTKHRELVERLLRRDYASPPPPPRDPAEKYSLALYFPESMLREIQDHATRTDHSLSFIVQFAWNTAYARIANSTRDALPSLGRYHDDVKQKQTLYYPGAMIDQFEQESLRLDSSQSFVVQTAYLIARADIANIPTPTGYPGADHE